MQEIFEDKEPFEDQGFCCKNLLNRTYAKIAKKLNLSNRFQSFAEKPYVFNLSEGIIKRKDSSQGFVLGSGVRQ